ncbi:MAG TPA: class I SAM-dependent methyltransferase [Pyrinomonadaceae bacterium]|jgi:SAM-dependent methyltransferase|nr:class I SAM-dependent methyltransferase [Pyrinomonadaceae bacterium]
MSSIRHSLKKFVPSSLHPLLGAVRRSIVANPLRTRLQKSSLGQTPDIPHRHRELFSKIDSKIDPRDGMYNGDARNYFLAALSCVDCIDTVLEAIGREDLDEILDLPSGHGRELRALVVRFPNASFTACDIQPGGVDFCAKRFGAKAVLSTADLGRLKFDRSFDLIWSGSLITHLDKESTTKLLASFYAHLKPGGIAIFTTHGDFVDGRLRSGETDYELGPEGAASLVSQYAAAEYGYRDYPRGLGYFDFHPDKSGYGVSIMSPRVVREIAAAAGEYDEVYFQPRGWADHQDVYALRRNL